MLYFFRFVQIVYKRTTIYIDSQLHSSIPNFLSEKYLFKVVLKSHFVGYLSILYFVDFEQILLQVLFNKLKSNIRVSVKTIKLNSRLSQTRPRLSTQTPKRLSHLETSYHVLSHLITSYPPCLTEK